MALNKGPPEEMERAKNGAMTWKQLAAVGVVISVLGAAQTAVIKPIVAESVRPVIEKEIEKHSNHPHPGAVSRREFDLLLKGQDDIRTELKELRRSR